MCNVLEIKNLTVEYKKMEYPVVNNISISLKKGNILGIVGESGCGKTTLAKTIIDELPSCGNIKNGNIDFLGDELTTITKKQRKNIQGCGIGIIIQESLSSLNPVKTIGSQFKQIVIEKLGVTKYQAEDISKEYLKRVNCSQDTFYKFPFQLSGGQRQRVIIAMAFALKPKMLIADEPTTALDVTIQAQILREMIKLKDENNTGIILISHNLGVVSQICDEVAVMYKGSIVEYGNVREVLSHPQHPYTVGLINSIPDINFNKNQRLFSIPDSTENSLKGCAFAPRCSKSCEECFNKKPDLIKNKKDVYVACLK